MNISKTLTLGFGFLIAVLLAKITLNELITRKANASYEGIKNEVQPTILMLNRFTSINREFSLLTTDYLNNGGTITRNKINKITDVEFEYFISEINAVSSLPIGGEQKSILQNQIIEETRNLINLGKALTEILVTRQDFNDPKKVRLAKSSIKRPLSEKQDNLNNMLETLQFKYNRDFEIYQDNLASNLTSTSKTIQIIGIIGILLGVFLAIVIIRSISNPIQKLAEGAQQVSRGNYNLTVKPEGNNELTKLTHSFNKMTRELNASFSALNKAKQAIQVEQDKLTIALSGASMGMFEWDIVSNILKWDDVMFNMYDVKPTDFTHVFDAWKNRLHPDDLERIEQKLQKAVAGEAEFDTGFRVIWPNSEIHHIRAKGKVFRNEKGKPITMISLNWDVTKERELENTLKENSAQLEQKNKELNQFAYIASHDLQEPVNTMNAFSDLILKQYGDNLDDTGKEYLNYIKESGLRTRELIMDLLEYSRLGHSIQMKPLDMNQLLRDVLQDLSANITKSETEVVVEELPSIVGSELQLRSLFQNLISNAIKFSPASRKPKIRVSAKTLDNAVQFTVSDNGIGIEEKYFDKIFAVFKRLHTKTDYPGTGIGLANCKKITEMHNGSIWLDSVKDQGSNFHFTISTKPV
ncbi:ATP-binding protein [Bacteroidota bacterium]